MIRGIAAPLTGAFRGQTVKRRLVSATAATAAVLGAAVALHAAEVPAPAPATSASAGRSPCFGSAAAGRAYLQADNDSTLISSTKDEVTVTAVADGSAHDCGPQGRDRPLDSITVELVITVRGSRLCHADTGPAGTCSSNRDTFTSTSAYTCSNEPSCRYATANKTFHADPDGRISTVETTVVVVGTATERPAINHRILMDSR